MAQRLKGRAGYPSDEPFRPGTEHLDKLDEPLRWRKPRRMFVCSMGDLFHDEVPDKYIAEIFGVMAQTSRREPPSKLWPNGRTIIGTPNVRYGPHTFMVLTKRPQRALKLLTSTIFRGLVASAAFRHAHNRIDAGHLSHQIGVREEYGRCYEPGRLWPLPNVWVGVTAEDQQRADERIPLLLKIPAAVRFVSVEPMLEEIDDFGMTRFDWLICGGETGPGARPMDISWARRLRDRCAAAGVPFFFKKPGSHRWAPRETPADLDIRQFPEVNHG